MKKSQLRQLIREEISKVVNENKKFTTDEIESLASSLDSELRFSSKTLKGRFIDLDIDFILSQDRNQLILDAFGAGYDDPQELLDDIEDEVGIPEYDFSIKGSKIYITKK